MYNYLPFQLNLNSSFIQFDYQKSLFFIKTIMGNSRIIDILLKFAY